MNAPPAIRVKGTPPHTVVTLYISTGAEICRAGDDVDEAIFSNFYEGGHLTGFTTDINNENKWWQCAK